VLKTLRQRFEEWAAQLPPEQAFRQVTSVRAWLVTSAVVLVAIAFAAWIPFSANLFQLRPWPALAAYLAAVLTDFVWIELLRRGRLHAAALLILLQTAMFQLFCVLLIINSSTEGAVFFASPLLAVAAIHGSVSRCDARHPFISVATVVVCGVDSSRMAASGGR
jgi:tryptophan-rich sensory protein